MFLFLLVAVTPVAGEAQALIENLPAKQTMASGQAARDSIAAWGTATVGTTVRDLPANALGGSDGSSTESENPS